MIHVDELQNGPGQIQFSMTLVQTLPVRLNSDVTVTEPNSLGRPGELILTGKQLLAGCVAAFSTVCLLLWAVIKLWLFER